MKDRYLDKSKQVFGHLSDEEVAGKVRMLMRNDLDHEAVCTGARDRIMYLSNQVDQFVEAEKSLLESIQKFLIVCEDVAGEAGRYWLEAQLRLGAGIDEVKAALAPTKEPTA